MRFSVDAHAVGQHLTGNETYIRNLLNAFSGLDTTAQFIAYVSRLSAFPLIPDRFEKRLVAQNPFIRLGYDLPRKVRQDQPDLLHVQYTAPVRCTAPVIASVHDVSFLEHPRFFTWFRAKQLRRTVGDTVHRAARILTASEFSKRAILKWYGLSEEKVVAIPYAVSSVFRPISREIAARWVNARYGFSEPFILTVGDLQPRKNYFQLISAFEELVRAYPRLPHHLVLVGKDTWYSPQVRRAAEWSPAARRIHLTGFVPDSDLTWLYNACDLFVYPSLYEGFGIPILEAMACARAVACSNVTAMPEVADSAALLFDPVSLTEMVRAIRDLLLDAELRTRMERLAAQRATVFSWDQTARKTLDVYYQVAGQVSSAGTANGKAASARAGDSRHLP